MGTERKDALTDVVQNLPAMTPRPADKPAGTVVAPNGTRVELGEKPSHTTAITSPQRGMNVGSDGK